MSGLTKLLWFVALYLALGYFFALTATMHPAHSTTSTTTTVSR